MKLCRTVTLTADNVLSHAVCPLVNLETTVSQVLAGPIKLSFDSFRLAALVESPEKLSPDFVLIDHMTIVWSILISDHVEHKPLFTNTSGGRALLLVGEIINNIFEGMHALGHRVERVAPNLTTNHLVITYSIERGTYAHAAIGAAMCLSTMMDGLLFVRGLHVSSSMISMLDEAKIGRLEFVNLYRFILTEIYGPTLRNSMLP